MGQSTGAEVCYKMVEKRNEERSNEEKTHGKSKNNYMNTHEKGGKITAMQIIYIRRYQYSNCCLFIPASFRMWLKCVTCVNKIILYVL